MRFTIFRTSRGSIRYDEDQPRPHPAATPGHATVRSGATWPCWFIEVPDLATLVKMFQGEIVLELPGNPDPAIEIYDDYRE